MGSKVFDQILQLECDVRELKKNEINNEVLNAIYLQLVEINENIKNLNKNFENISINKSYDIKSSNSKISNKKNEDLNYIPDIDITGMKINTKKPSKEELIKLDTDLSVFEGLGD